MKRPRLKRWGKWACTLAAVLMVGLAVFSRFWGITYAAVFTDGDVLLNAEGKAGGIIWYWQSGGIEQESAGQSRLLLTQPRAWLWGFHDEMVDAQIADGWHAGLWYGWNSEQRFLGASLVFPFVLFTIPAALLWYKDRR